MTALIGTRQRRADGEAKVRGTAVFGMDYTEPGALHAAVLRAEVPAGRILRLDTTRAASMPGVWAVACAGDTPGLSGMGVLDQRAFADGVIRYAGEPIAAVAAETPAQVQAALAAIELVVEPLEPVFDLESALLPETRLIHPGWESYEQTMPAPRHGNLVWQASMERGDVDAIFAGAEIIVEDTYRVPRQHQSSIEPHAVVARFEQGRYIVHTPSQFPYMVRSRTAELLGVRPSQVRVVVPTVGGGFGGKLDAMLEPLACALARKAGRPVRLVNSRAEEMATAGPRENAVVRLRTAVSREGEILAQAADVLADNGANCSGETTGCANIPGMVFGSVYRIPNARYRTKVVYTNTPPTAAFRGVNAPYCVFAREMHLDHIARVVGMDRREIRMRNLIEAGDAMVNGQVLDDAVLGEAMSTVDDLVAAQERPAGRSPLRGTATVPLTWITNPGPAATAVKLEDDGTVMVTSGAAEIGTGAVATGVRQIVADELGVPFDRVIVTGPDTDASGYDHGAQGSRTTVGMGSAALDASRKVRQQVLDVAAGMLEADAADLELADGAVRVAGVPDMTVSLAAVAGAALFSRGPIGASGTFAAPPIPFDSGCMVGAMFTTFFAATYHAHFAEVEVDPETGRVTVLRYAVAQDVGRAINPQMIEGQIHGGVVQGIGYALYENLRVENGVVLDNGFESYRLPTALDAPPIGIELIENPYPHGPLGAKGVAEPPIVPVAAVIACAVADAIGAPVNSLPLSPFEVLAAMRSKESTR